MSAKLHNTNDLAILLHKSLEVFNRIETVGSFDLINAIITVVSEKFGVDLVVKDIEGATMNLEARAQYDLTLYELQNTEMFMQLLCIARKYQDVICKDGYHLIFRKRCAICLKSEEELPIC